MPPSGYSRTVDGLIPKRVYLAGIGGTFMTGLARLMQERGIEVAGCDNEVWPPMSTQLSQMGINPERGWNPGVLDEAYDSVIVGNILSRGNPLVEALLNQRSVLTSGPQWLARHILADRQVVAIAGTHGKTTTTAMLAWILDQAGKNSGFLLGGLVKNFNVTARLGEPTAPFVIEADEYDTAFFDKRPKFIHYRPDVLILSNLEFDHADIYSDFEAIQKQFHYLLRMVPQSGKVIYRAADAGLQSVMKMGTWSPCEAFGLDGDKADWTARDGDGGFEVFHQGMPQGSCRWHLLGRHNISNALSAIAAAYHLNVPIASSLSALESFEGVSRRLEIVVQVAGVTVYDDFAHHPTEINASLEAVRRRCDNNGRVLAVFEPRSNSMKLGTHNEQLLSSFGCADKIFIHQPTGLSWDPATIFATDDRAGCFASTDALLEDVLSNIRAGDHVVVMSNGSFEGLPARIGERLNEG